MSETDTKSPTYQLYGDTLMVHPVWTNSGTGECPSFQIISTGDILQGKRGTATISVYGRYFGLPMHVIERRRW